jgi:hypothetical protein
LGGELDYASAVLALQDDALMAHPEATLKFVNQFRGDVVESVERF